MEFTQTSIEINSGKRFVPSILLTDAFMRHVKEAAQEFGRQCVLHCAETYNFDGNNALVEMNLDQLEVKIRANRTIRAEKKPKEPRVVKQKTPKFPYPIPYSGEQLSGCCFALKKNQGLYTQCTSTPMDGVEFCKTCYKYAVNNDGVPEYGTIQSRLAADIMEYSDPKGKKPVPFMSILNKIGGSVETYKTLAEQYGIRVDEVHFAPIVEKIKRGRPVAEKKTVVKESKGPKGRPKKAKKMVVLETTATDDLFAQLVQQSVVESGSEDEEDPSENDSQSVVSALTEASSQKREQKSMSSEEKLSRKTEKEAKKAQEAAEKEAKKAQEAAEKLAEKEAKELKKAQEAAQKLAEKEAKKAEEAAQKLAEKEAKELKKAEEAAKKLAEKESKSKKPAEKETKPKKSSKKVETPVIEPEEDEDEEEEEAVKVITYEEKKYLLSSSNVVYDYEQYKKDETCVVVGKWDPAKKLINFKTADDDEEEEDEYED